jgi:Protein of unknown function (DUF3638)
VGRHLVYLVYLQKATRCLEMVDTWESTREDQRRHFGQRLIREIAEPHCEVWAPEDHPKWLIFEVENNVLIRRIQAQVALKIISGEKQILQLNMGEGKTSVISPLVCSSLADGKHVVQLTLLTSLLETHGQELALKLSGLLEQPVYYFPCRRDIRFDKNLIDRMITSFKECVKQGGCIVTVPEFRLSLQLKLEEMIIHQVNHFDGKMSEEVKFLLQLFELHQSHVIDLVDEADEILRHKYQLLYTMGSQVSIDGGERRWQVLQDVLTFLFPQSQLNEESCTISSDLARLELNEEESESKLVTVVIDELLSGQISGLAYFALFHSQPKERIRKYLSNQLQSVPETLQLSDMYETLQSSALAKSVLRQTKNRHVQSLSQSFRDVVASQLGESEVLGEAVRIASAVVEHGNKYLGQMELKFKCLDEEQEKELEEEEEREVHRPQHYDPFKPRRPKWIDDVLNHRRISSIRELTPLWEAMKRTRVHSLSSNKDFDPRILTSDNFRRVLK